MNCLNCGGRLTCGCQKKVASDGKQVCSQCKDSYEKKLELLKIAALDTNKLKT